LLAAGTKGFHVITTARHCQKWRHLGMSGQAVQVLACAVEGHRARLPRERSGDGGLPVTVRFPVREERKSTDAAGGGQRSERRRAGIIRQETLGSCFVVILARDFDHVPGRARRKTNNCRPIVAEWIGQRLASAPDPNRCGKREQGVPVADAMHTRRGLRPLGRP